MTNSGKLMKRLKKLKDPMLHPPSTSTSHQQWASTSQNPSQLGPWPMYHMDARGNVVAGPAPPGTPPRKKRPKSATKRWRQTKGVEGKKKSFKPKKSSSLDEFKKKIKNY